MLQTTTDSPLSPAGTPRPRADLHCHSVASNKTGEAMLNMIACPESYSPPTEVYGQALARGMTFVTLTDHDSIEGAMSLAGRPDVLVGEEVTVWFPEDGCKIHFLAYGIDRPQHAELQRLAKDVYAVAEYVEREGIAHSVAHPIYRQNDKLERWHLERLLLLFKGFECLNGAHSNLHRTAFEPLLDKLDAAEIRRLAEVHDIAPRWPEPWKKARTGGSDDHGLLNVGRTWTEFPTGTKTVEDVLRCLREGECSPGGEAGSALKLAHTFYGVGVRYYTRHLLAPGGGRANVATLLLQTLVGERAMPTKLEMAGAFARSRVRRAGRWAMVPVATARTGVAAAWGGLRRGTGVPPASAPLPPSTKIRESGRDARSTGGGDSVGLIKRLFLDSARRRLGDHPELLDTLKAGLPPLGEHGAMFDFIRGINRDVSAGVSDAVADSIDRASLVGLFDSISAAMAQQFVLSPYYFALFHQNKERQLLGQITRQVPPRTARTLKVGLFTDTFDEVNGVGRFVRDMAAQATAAGCDLTVHTCADPATLKFDVPNRANFAPLLSRPLPLYEELALNLPPVLEVLEWADRQQFDVIHVSTPGPMGLCGWLAAKMLRVPTAGTYHTDFPAYALSLTGDHRVANGVEQYVKWFYDRTKTVFTRSDAYKFNLRDLGVPDGRVRSIVPGIDLAKFNPGRRDPGVWRRLGVAEPLRVLYVGRVSVEKNLPLLADAFGRLCGRRRDVALVVAGDGPYRTEMQRRLKHLPAHFLGVQGDDELAALYASADLFAFPSRTDTLGQAVMEAQASGLPAVVSPDGGPKETVSDGRPGEPATGRIVPATDPAAWADALADLLDDPAQRSKLGRAAAARAAERYSLARTFAAFWADHLAASAVAPRDDAAVPAAVVAEPVP